MEAERTTKTFEMFKVTEHGRVTVYFHVETNRTPPKVNVVTVAGWSGAGSSAFTMTAEEARTEWTRLTKVEGFKVKKGAVA